MRHSDTRISAERLPVCAAGAVVAVGTLGEPYRFFDSSSESSCLEWTLERLAGVEVPAGELPAASLPRFPYLLFKYRAHELRAAPSFSPAPVRKARGLERRGRDGEDVTE